MVKALYNTGAPCPCQPPFGWRVGRSGLGGRVHTMLSLVVLGKWLHWPLPINVVGLGRLWGHPWFFATSCSRRPDQDFLVTTSCW
jgi:hypothetical protein